MGVRSESQFWESPSFGLVQQINQVLSIPNILCLFGFIFPKELLLWFVHHMYTGLSNGRRINDSRMVVRSVSVHSPVNAASGARTDLRIQALSCLYRITPTPCIDIDFGARPYFFYYSLCINYLLCYNFLIIIITIISGLHYFLCTGK